MKYIRDRNSEMSVGRKPVLSISLKNEGPATAGTLHYSPRLGESLLAGFLLPSHGVCISTPRLNIGPRAKEEAMKRASSKAKRQVVGRSVPTCCSAISDAQVSEWADRHAFQGTATDLRCAFEDAATLVAEYKPLPNGLDRDDAIESLWEVVKQAERDERRRDPSFVRWPDLDGLIEHISAHGFPPQNPSLQGTARAPYPARRCSGSESEG